MSPTNDARASGASAWARAMDRNRPTVNAWAAAVLAEGARAELVTDAIRATGGGLDRWVSADADPVAVDAWSLALLEEVFTAVRARRWSPRTVSPWCLTRLAPRLLPHLDPRLLDRSAGVTAPPVGTSTARALLADLAHAADQVWRAADVARWGELLADAVAAGATTGHGVDRARLRDLGVVAAWRAGHVRLREAAHRVAPGLPDAALAAAVGLPESPPDRLREVLRRNADDPVAWPADGPADGPDGPAYAGGAADEALHRIGGFTAYGGPFAVPPRVVDGDGLTWRLEADGPWLLLADVHGVHLERDRSAADPVPPTGRPDGRPVRHQRGHALLVASPRSHVLIHARAATGA